MDWRDQEIVAEEVLKSTVLERPHQWRATFVADGNVRIHVRNQFRMKPRKLPDNLKFRLAAQPETTLSMTPIQEQPTECREFRPTDVEVGRDFIAMAGRSGGSRGRRITDILRISIAV